MKLQTRSYKTGKITIFDSNELTTLYQNKSIQDIANKFSVPITTVFKMFHKLGIKTRNRTEAASLSWKNRSHLPTEQPNWKGGKTCDAKGYVRIYNPNHPRAHGVYVYEHILNWEKANGQLVPKGVCIHHLNGIKDDNRPENLMALPRNKHETGTLINILRERIRELETKIKQLEEEQ